MVINSKIKRCRHDIRVELPVLDNVKSKKEKQTQGKFTFTVESLL